MILNFVVIFKIILIGECAKARQAIAKQHLITPKSHGDEQQNLFDMLKVIIGYLNAHSATSAPHNKEIRLTTRQLQRHINELEPPLIA